MKTLVLPETAQNIEDTEKILDYTYSRLVRKLLYDEYAVLGVTDRAFYYILLHDYSYVARSSLYSLVNIPTIAGEPLIKKVTVALKKTRKEEKPFIAFALISDSLPDYIFNYKGEVDTEEDLIKIMIDYVKTQKILNEVDRCEEIKMTPEKREVIEKLFATIIEVFDFMGVKPSFGVTELGEPCIITYGKLYTIDKNVILSVF